MSTRFPATTADIRAAGTPFEIDGVSLPGYVVGYCGHRVAGSEFTAGYLTCERCGTPELPADPDNTLTVRVRDTAAEIARCGTLPIVVTIVISASCPICGKRRGEPTNQNLTDNGARYSVQTWDNPCGHIDRPEALVTEAAAL